MIGIEEWINQPFNPTAARLREIASRAEEPDARFLRRLADQIEHEDVG